jgi:hypothetical protein
MEGDASNNILNLTTLLKDVRKSTNLEFANAYEKYVFKTIVYNHLVINRFII